MSDDFCRQFADALAVMLLELNGYLEEAAYQSSLADNLAEITEREGVVT